MGKSSARIQIYLVFFIWILFSISGCSSTKQTVSYSKNVPSFVTKNFISYCVASRKLKPIRKERLNRELNLKVNENYLYLASNQFISKIGEFGGKCLNLKSNLCFLNFGILIRKFSGGKLISHRKFDANLTFSSSGQEFLEKIEIEFECKELKFVPYIFSRFG